jgi:hypothetical protein
MSFTDGKPTTVIEAHLRASWMGGKNGKYFRCAMCGYRFKLGDVFRFVFTNDMPKAGGNPIVCQKCDGHDEKVRADWAVKCAENSSERNWWFHRGEDQ